jgi:hypothetical protein
MRVTVALDGGIDEFDAFCDSALFPYVKGQCRWGQQMIQILHKKDQTTTILPEVAHMKLRISFILIGMVA